MIRSSEFNEKILEISRSRNAGIPLTGLKLTRAITDELKGLTGFLDLYYGDVSISQRLYHILENIKEVQFCQYCGELPRKFHRLNTGYFNTCGNVECKNSGKVISFKKTINEKYNGSFFKNGSESREKYKITMLEKYGVDHNFKSTEIRNSIKLTMVNKYGTETPLQNPDILNRRNQTCLEKHGTLDFINSDKSKSSNLIKYGHENPMKNHEISNKVAISSSKSKRLNLSNKLEFFNISLIRYDSIRSEFFCNKCSTYFPNHPVTINSKLRSGIDPCIKCNPPDFSSSKLEKEFSDFISSVYNGAIINNARNPFMGTNKFSEVDVYLPDLKIALEFNGLYWHSEIYKYKGYHKEKSEYLMNSGIRLYHIWEDDWLYKKDIVKSMISSILGIHECKIYARKCKIDIVNPSEYKKFCENNHLKGYSPASLILGLYYEDKLVSISSFSKTRKMIDSKNSNVEYELIRSCTLKNYIIIGGVSKLIKHFTRNISNSLVTYCDSSFSPDPLATSYFKSGLNYIKSTDPGYYWCIEGKRSNRLNWTKSKLVSLGYSLDDTADNIMNSLGHYKIWDCGNHKFST